MTLWDYILQFMSEVCEGRRPAPEGITLTAEGQTERAMELLEQISDIPAFVAACAKQDGTVIEQEAYDSFDPAQLPFFVQPPEVAPDFEDPPSAQAAEDANEADPPGMQRASQSTEPLPTPSTAEAAPVERHAFEVFLDSILLEDKLVSYLIDVLRRKDTLAFFKLSEVAARVDIDPQEFLFWLGNKEFFGSDEEQVCVLLMDACCDRLVAEGNLELLAALLSGDKASFEAFRCEAPELLQLPIASYDWFARYYLDGYYPLRRLMKFNGVVFPAAAKDA